MLDFKAKMHQNRFRFPLLGELPRPSSWNKGDLLLREGEACKGRCWEGKEEKRGGRDKKGEVGKDRKEREGRG